MAAKKKATSKKKAAATTTTAKKTAASSTAKKTAAAPAVKKAPTKTEILNHIAGETEMTRKEVQAVLDSLSGLIAKNLKPRAAGTFTVPGLMKIKVVKRAATKKRKGVNPFTGEEIMIAAKPARKAVKVLPLKGLKDMV